MTQKRGWEKRREKKKKRLECVYAHLLLAKERPLGATTPQGIATSQCKSCCISGQQLLCIHTSHLYSHYFIVRHRDIG